MCLTTLIFGFGFWWLSSWQVWFDLIVILIFLFLMISGTEYVFLLLIYLLAICISEKIKILCMDNFLTGQLFFIFVISVVFVFAIELSEFFICILMVNILIYGLQMFFSFYCFFILFVSFPVQKVLMNVWQQSAIVLDNNSANNSERYHNQHIPVHL